MAIKTGDTVAFKAAVVKRCGNDKLIADMRGKVLSISGVIAKVDTFGTFPNEDGNSIRHIPIANICLTEDLAFTE